MIKVKCNNCQQIMYRSPSKVEPRNYCSRECYSTVRNKELLKRGKPHRITSNNREKIYDPKSIPQGSEHYAWKGKKVSYRGLHYWIRRKLGKPTECKECGKTSNKPRIIQWASIDGKYPRDISNYTSLCASCHKIKDLAIQATQDERSASL